MFTMFKHFYIVIFFKLLVYVLASESSVCPNVENEDRHVFQFDNHEVCYEYVESNEDGVDYATADSSCSSKGGYLVTIKTNTTQVSMVSKLQQLSSSHTILLGLKREDGTWTWSTGEEASYTNWKTPSTECNSCDCVRMLLSENGVWEPFDCRLREWYPVYVCEFGSGFSINTNDRTHQMIVAVLTILSVYTTSFTGGH